MNQLTVTRVPSPVTKTNLLVSVIFDYLSSIVLPLETWQSRHETSMQFDHVEARLLRDLGALARRSPSS
jgi:hypothetical protein